MRRSAYKRAKKILEMLENSNINDPKGLLKVEKISNYVEANKENPIALKKIESRAGRNEIYSK